MSFQGFRRDDGTVGTRNHVLVVSTVVCANQVARGVANSDDNARYITHPMGCGHLGLDFMRVLLTLAGFGRNPNVAGALVVGLGCENMQAKLVADEISKSKKPVQHIIIQEEGGTIKATKRGIEILQDLLKEASQSEREKCELSELLLGLECGGSDATSGIVGNPAVGVAADAIVKLGGTVILPEATEWIGAEHLLAKRAVNGETGKKIYAAVDKYISKVLSLGIDVRGTQPTPGNIEGGITTIEEKSLGTICKAGNSPVQGLLEYAEKPPGKGLYLMDEPGLDVESITGLVAAGSQLITFTTGLGTPAGSPIAPVIKVTGNHRTFKNMEDNIDIDVSTILEGKETLQQAGDRILKEIVEVASGKLTKAEKLKNREFAIYRAWQYMV
ncbi:MAG: UxaA family hydrolase [Candidatus Jordarchaeum sp.]|uniref:UxaA family hydrolase n=1 Tax=Candidatus Jordarchaeum sp. TaxID=2823881 RepID=UPI004049942A